MYAWSGIFRQKIPYIYIYKDRIIQNMTNTRNLSQYPEEIVDEISYTLYKHC